MYKHITKEEAINKVRKNGFNIEYLPHKLKEDDDVIKEALLNDIDAIYHINKSYWTNLELIKYVLQNKYHRFDFFHCMPESIRFNKEVALLACKYNIEQLKYTNPEFRFDREFMFEIIMHNGSALNYASEDLKLDKELILTALRCQHNSSLIILESIPDVLRTDKEVVIEAVQLNGDLLKDASLNLRTDYDVVLAAVNSKGKSLGFASFNLRANREIVLAAISNDGEALEYASAELCADRDIGKIAIKNSNKAFIYLSEELQFDKDYIIELLQNGNTIYKFIPDHYKLDSVLIDVTLKCDGMQLVHVPISKRTEERCLLAVKENGCAIKFCQDPTSRMVSIAIKQSHNALTYAPVKYRSEFNLLY